jgi:predicted hydrocarbon binding protein
MEPFEILTEEDITGWDRDKITEVFMEYKNGKVEFIKKAQVASMYNTFLIGVYLELKGIVGMAARGLILNAAKKGGLRAGKGIRGKYEREKGELTREKAILIARNMLEIWSRGFGWGNFKVNFGRKGVAVAIFDSFEADGYKRLREENAESGMCWMLFGYIWGMLEGLLNVKLEGEDKMCASKGDNYCYIEFNFIE